MCNFSIFYICFLSPYDPNKIDILSKFQGPSIKHIFGTDELGRDYFTRALYGGRAFYYGRYTFYECIYNNWYCCRSISGYIGGFFDSIVMRIIDMLCVFLYSSLILIANAYLKPSIVNTIVIIGAFGWMGIARIVRSETLSYKEREYVLIAKSLGASNWHIIKKHIIPNVLPTVIVASSINIADAILTESALSFLGLGRQQQPMASWEVCFK